MKLQLSRVTRVSYIPHLELVLRTDPIRFRTHTYLNQYFEANPILIEVLFIDEACPGRGIVVEQLALTRQLHQTDRGIQRHQIQLTDNTTLSAVELHASANESIGVPTLLTRERWLHRSGTKVTATILSPLWL